MANKKLELQAKVFLYELNNTRHEYGFTATEEWTLEFNTVAQKTALENRFYPILSTEIDRTDLNDFLDLLKKTLEYPVSKLNDQLEAKSGVKGPHLVAYCTARLKH